MMSDHGIMSGRVPFPDRVAALEERVDAIWERVMAIHINDDMEAESTSVSPGEALVAFHRLDMPVHCENYDRVRQFLVSTCKEWANAKSVPRRLDKYRSGLDAIAKALRDSSVSVATAAEALNAHCKGG